MTSKSFQNIFVQQVKRLPLCPLYGQCWLVGLSTGFCLMVGQLNKNWNLRWNFWRPVLDCGPAGKGGRVIDQSAVAAIGAFTNQSSTEVKTDLFYSWEDWQRTSLLEHTKNIICYFQLPNELFYVTFLAIVEEGKKWQQSVRFFKKAPKFSGEAGRRSFSFSQ